MASGYSAATHAGYRAAQSARALRASLPDSIPLSNRKGWVGDGGTIFSIDNPCHVSWRRLSGEGLNIFPQGAVQSSV